MANYRPWLRDVAIWLNGAMRKPSVSRRLSTVVRWSGETHRRRLRDTDDPGNWAEFPPDRALSLVENYELVIAIHNAVCTDLKYERLDPRTYWRAGGAALNADLWIIKLRNRVHEIRDHDFNQLLDAVKAVAKDLGVKAPRLTRPAQTIRKVVKERERVTERHFLPAAQDPTTSRGSAKKPGRKPKTKPNKVDLIVAQMIDCGDVTQYDRQWKMLIERYRFRLPKDYSPDALRKRVDAELARRKKKPVGYRRP